MDRMLLLALVAPLMLVTPSLAFKEPDSFRGIPWKASEESVRLRWPELRCSTLEHALHWTRLCSTLDPITIEGIPVKPIVGFRSDEFGYVALSFDVAHFSTVERLFVERYGPPTRQEQEPMPSPTGTTVTNELRYWVGPKVSITLQKYGSTLTEGRARYQFTAL